jgi:hypothetical protein
MKTPNSLEDLMRSWTPRQPSPRIEEALFGADSRTAKAQGRKRSAHHLPWWQTLGASAVAFAVAIMTLLNVAELSVTGAASRSTLLSLSNHSCAASFALASAPINTWRAPILGWTNEGASGSIPRSFDLLGTNRILR